jgi:hypothetical protein
VAVWAKVACGTCVLCIVGHSCVACVVWAIVVYVVWAKVVWAKVVWAKVVWAKVVCCVVCRVCDILAQ